MENVCLTELRGGGGGGGGYQPIYLGSFDFEDHPVGQLVWGFSKFQIPRRRRGATPKYGR